MIEVRRLQSTDIDLVKKVHLADEQIKFSGTAIEFLTTSSKTVHLHLITSANEIVGFFKLDTGYAKNYSFCPNDGIGLRAFAVDKSQQGKGIGTKAVKALFSYIPSNYPEFNSIYLTVNFKNPGAKACYLKGGFECLAEPYLGGSQGPQYIMRGKI